MRAVPQASQKPPAQKIVATLKPRRAKSATDISRIGKICDAEQETIKLVHIWRSNAFGMFSVVKLYKTAIFKRKACTCICCIYVECKDSQEKTI